MKRENIITLLLGFIFMFSTTLYAQTEEQARKVLDKASIVINASEGASAQFKISGSNGLNNAGSITIKKNKFHISTSQAIIWYDGKTQWSYIKKNDEVNISNPNASQQAVMNPYAFINMYKKGYKLSLKAIGNNNQVHLVSTIKNASIKEMLLVINKKTSVISSARILNNGSWLTITINNFKAKKVSDNIFTFKRKDFPTAEVIDIR